MRLVAYAGAWALRNPARAVELAQRCGLAGLCIVLHDRAGQRRASKLALYSPRRIYALADACHDAGLGVEALAWVMRHEAFTAEAADVLPGLLDSIGAESLQLDAEEPWTQSRGPGTLDPEEASIRWSDAVLEPVRQSDVTIGVSAIGYMPRSVFPLTSVADYVSPQWYTTRTSQLRPSGLPRVAGWLRRRLPGLTPDEIRPAVAAYRQIPGELEACLEAVDGLGCSTAYVWQLKSLRGRGAEPLRRTLARWGSDSVA